MKKLIESKDDQLTSIEEIKANGIKIMINEKEVIVKFETLDQRTKDMLELKFAKKVRDQQLSKLQVLRMLLARK